MADKARMTLDRAGRILKVDQAFAATLRTSPDRLIGNNALDYTAPADRERCRALLATLLVDRRPVSTVKRLIRADGTHIWANHALIYLDDVGNGPGCALTCAPVDPRHSLEPDQLLRIARFVDRSRRARAAAFDHRLFTDPAWDLLIAAYIREAEGDVIDPRTLFAAIDVSPAVGWRWVKALAAEHLVVPEHAPAGSAPRPFTLSADAHERIERYLAGLDGMLPPADRPARAD